MAGKTSVFADAAFSRSLLVLSFPYFLFLFQGFPALSQETQTTPCPTSVSLLSTPIEVGTILNFSLLFSTPSHSLLLGEPQSPPTMPFYTGTAVPSEGKKTSDAIGPGAAQPALPVGIALSIRL